MSTITLAKAAVTRKDVTVIITDAESGGTPVTLHIAGDATIEELKRRYASVIGPNKQWNGYTLTFLTFLIPPDSCKISSIPGHASGTELSAKATYKEPPFVVNVRGLDGRTKMIHAHPNWTVRHLKEEYGKWLGEGFDKVVMLYRARHLKDADTLSTYMIESEGFIQANVRSFGGVDMRNNAPNWCTKHTLAIKLMRITFN